MSLNKKISNVRIAIIVAGKSEDAEVIVPFDIWKRAGIIIELISVEKKNTIVLQSGTKIYATTTLDKVNLSPFNAIYLPGGEGHLKFKELKTDKLSKALEKFASINENKWILAMCAAPSLLAYFNLITNQKLTAYPGYEGALGKHYVDEDVVVSGNFITARSLAHAVDFSLQVVETLLDKETADRVKKEICYREK